MRKIEDFKFPLDRGHEHNMMLIFKRIKDNPSKEWMINDFLDITSYSIIARTLSRLAKEGTVSYVKRCPVKITLR